MADRQPHGAVAARGPLGILAGGGGLPEQIAASVTARGRGVHIIAIEGEAGPAISRYPHTWVNWGGIGRMIGSLRTANARDLIIVGSVTRPDPRKVRPDLGLLAAIPTILRLFGGGDDHVLRNVVRFFEMQGFVVQGVADVAPELLVVTGALGRIAPGPAFVSDAMKGFALIEALGPSDVGQAVVMRGGSVLAIEAAEGTDRMLQRLAVSGSRLAKGAVLVKSPKPGQELRVDMPVIGPRTMLLAAELELGGVAVASGGVLIAERAAVIDNADSRGLFVAGVEWQRSHDAVHTCGSGEGTALSPLTLRLPEEAVRLDMARGLRVLSALATCAASAGVIVVRRHVIAIETGEGLDAMFERVKALRQWGATAKSKRRGALALNTSLLDPERLVAAVEAAADAGLSGVVFSLNADPNLIDQGVEAAIRCGLTAAEAKGNWHP